MEAVGLTCAEAARKVLRWQPDAGISFDYSTTPPTLNVTRRATATALQLTLGEAPLQGVPEIQSLENLQVPGVALIYEFTHEVDGETTHTVTIDKYPADLDLDAPPPDTVIHTIELSGYRRTNQKQELVSETISKDSVAWWQKFYPELPDDATIVNSATAAVNDGDPSSWTKYVVDGAVPERLKENHAGELRVWARMNYQYEDDDGRIVEFKGDEMGVQITGTDLSTRTHSRPTSETQAEAAPVGLAESFYNALQELHWQGSVTTVEEECSQAVRPGYVLQILGSDVTAWSTMKAQIQSVTEDVDSGVTSMKIGAPEQLSPQDLVELLRAHRGEPATTRLNERNNGQPGDNTSNLGSGATKLKNATKAGSNIQRLVLVSTDGNTTITIDPDLDGIKVENGADVAWLKFDQVTVSDGSGNNAGMTKDAIGLEASTGETAELTADDLTVTSGSDESVLTAADLTVTSGAGSGVLSGDSVEITAGGNTGTLEADTLTVTDGSNTATVKPNEAKVTDGTSNGTLKADEMKIAGSGTFAKVVDNQVYIEGAAGTGYLEADKLSLSDGSSTVDIDCGDLTTDSASLIELEYCDEGTAMTFKGLATTPAA